MNVRTPGSSIARGMRLAAILLVMVGTIERGAAEGGVIFVTSVDDKISATGGCSLKEAIYSANFDTNMISTPTTFFSTGCAAGHGADTIILPAGYVFHMSKITDQASNPFGPTATPMITSTITIEANGARLEWIGSTPARAIAVASTGLLTIRNAHIKGFIARGGDGGSGGGGGMGAGGAIYVKGGGTLNVDACTFEGNGAIGGSGSAGSGGGGGGLGGNGGHSGNVLGGGGGGGARGNGATPLGIFGAGGGGTVTDAADSAGGLDCGGDGAHAGIDVVNNTDGQPGQCPGGGGGGGASIFGGLFDSPGNGGAGAYGGGGGGAGWPGSGSRDGGAGGFGAGGGAASGEPTFGFGSHGGSGGYGGGGGAAKSGAISGGPGLGGSEFAGDASETAGGGGAGLGGAIFNDGGTVSVTNSTFTTNYGTVGSSGGDSAQGGGASGAAIFSLNGTLTVLYATIAGNGCTLPCGAIVVRQIVVNGSLPPAVFELRNSIVTEATNSPACDIGGASPTVNGSGNLVQGTAADSCPGAFFGDPLLGPLQQNGGFTPTMAIAQSSPAVDQADPSKPLLVDQRGIDRPQLFGFDIGAYERCPPPSPILGLGCISFQPPPIAFTVELTTRASPAVGGTVTPPSATHTLNSVVALSATPNPGYSFINWSGDVADPASPSTFVAMDQDQIVTANFVSCGSSVSGRGTPGSALALPRIDLTWTAAGADHANVLRGATSGGPYSLVGASSTTAFSDRTSGLVNNTKVYYVLQFFAATGVKICDSNEVNVIIPKGR